MIRQSTNNPIKKINEPKPNNTKSPRGILRQTSQHDERVVQKNARQTNRV